MHDLLLEHTCARLHAHAHTRAHALAITSYHHRLLKMVLCNTAKSKMYMKFIKTFGLVAVTNALLELADSF
jgi:hypothetical protein